MHKPKKAQRLTKQHTTGQTMEVVEFLGLPGVGKTLLCHASAELLRDEGLLINEITYDIGNLGSLQRYLRKWRFVFQQVLLHPRLSSQMLQVIIKSRQQGFWSGFRVAFNWLYVTSIVRKGTTSKRIFLLDQGIFQGVWSVLFNAKEPNLTHSLAQTILKMYSLVISVPILVIIVYADRAAVMERLRQRKGGRSPLNGVSNPDLSKAEDALEGTKAVLSIVAGSYQSVSVIVINNAQTNDTGEIVSDLCSAIRGGKVREHLSNKGDF